MSDLQGMGGFEVFGEKRQPLIVEWLGMGSRFQQRAAEPQYGHAGEKIRSEQRYFETPSLGSVPEMPGRIVSYLVKEKKNDWGFTKILLKSQSKVVIRRSTSVPSSCLHTSHPDRHGGGGRRHGGG